MKYVIVTVEFFKEYWGEIWHAAKLTASLWTEIVKLAPKLAQKWQKAANGDQ